MIKGTRVTFSRFAPAIFSAITGTVFAIILTYYDEDIYHYEHLFRYIFCAAIGLPLLIAIRLFSERKEIPVKSQIMYYLIAFILLAGYFFTLPLHINTITFLRFALLIIAMHLLVSFSAYTGKKEINGFWQFNKALFLRFLTSALFSFVLFLGLSLAILAIDELFSANIDERFYLRLWIIIVGIFNTWFFLSGVPLHIEKLDSVSDYPKGLKIFTQYILLPLVLIYFVIIYAYTFKIIITWHFPSGWVSNLVLFLSISGIFSLLLINPIKDMEENKWINTFRRLFYIFLLPMLILLAISIWKRIDQYGVTENRYFIVIINLWLAFISLYFIFSKLKNIKIIPITLCFLSLFTYFGPWSAFSISRKSQLHQLENVLTDSKMLKNGKIQNAPSDLTSTKKHKIINLFFYFDERNELNEFQPWYKQNIDSLLASDSSRWFHKSGKLLDLIGIEVNEYFTRNEKDSTSEVFNFNADITNIDIHDFDFMINYHSNDNAFMDFTTYTKNENEKPGIKLNDRYNLDIKLNDKNGMLSFISNNKTMIDISLSSIPAILKKYKSNHQKEKYNSALPIEAMTFEKENKNIRLRIYINRIDGCINKNKTTSFSYISAWILVKFKMEEK